MSNEIINDFIENFENLWEKEMNELNTTQSQLLGGSRLRPLMVLWGYLSNVKNSEKIELQYIADVSISIEFIHKGSILIDDWIDNDDYRHGNISFHKEFSSEYAVIFALNLIAQSVSRLDDIINSSIHSKNYNYCLDTIIKTLGSMSSGCLKEVRLNTKTILELNTIEEIAKLETADIIGNSLLLGYYANSGNNIQTATLLKKIGNQCGYIFQALNDLEAFYNSKYLQNHKGNINNDIESNRKNIAIAILYNIANKKDKEIIENGKIEDIVQLVKKYDILNFVYDEMFLLYNQLPKYMEHLIKQGVDKEWVNNFLIFLDTLKIDALKRLGLN